MNSKGKWKISLITNMTFNEQKETNRLMVYISEYLKTNITYTASSIRRGKEWYENHVLYALHYISKWSVAFDYANRYPSSGETYVNNDLGYCILYRLDEFEGEIVIDVIDMDLSVDDEYLHEARKGKKQLILLKESHLRRIIRECIYEALQNRKMTV